jgi:hypothetical protein
MAEYRLLERPFDTRLVSAVTALALDLTKDNRPMLRLNLSAGFEVIGTNTRDSLPRVILQKRLGAA